MTDETKIERFFVPTLAQLEPLRSNGVGDDELAKVQAVLQRWHDEPDFSHEDALKACDEILGTSGIESVDPEGASHHYDEGIRMCPPFSYCNAGDTYATTLARDHKASAWVVACWGDLLQEVEETEELGDFEVFEECPDYCPSCHGKAFTLEFFPGSGRGPAYSWVCVSCNHHCFAESVDEVDHPTVKIGEDENGADVCVQALAANALAMNDARQCDYIVLVDGEEWRSSDKRRITFDSAEDARQSWETEDVDDDIPADWPVLPLKEGAKVKGAATCGTCGRSWNDERSTEMTPTPSARCPFEAFHDSVEDDSDDDGGDVPGTGEGEE